MARQTSATRMFWQSTYCVLLRRKLTQQSHSKSSSQFLKPEPLQSNYRPHPNCLRGGTHGKWPNSCRNGSYGPGEE